MACTRSALLERRPDLPLCSLRRVRQLCAGNTAMFSSTGLDNAARDTRSLLQTPLKVASLPRRDQIAIGKAIVGRLGKDDNWVTNSTAGWTFAAATREMPEGCRRPVSVEKLRQVSRRVHGGGRGARQGRSAADSRKYSQQAQADAISELIGDRDLALLDAGYRLATSESRASTAQGMSSSLSAGAVGGSRRRRPKTHHGISPAQAEAGSESQGFEDSSPVLTRHGEAVRSELAERRSTAAARPRIEGPGEIFKEAEEAGERRAKLSGVPGTPPFGQLASRWSNTHGGRSLTRCGLVGRKPRPPKQRKAKTNTAPVREYDPRRNFEESGRVQGSKMVPQRHALGRGPATERDQKSGRVLGKNGVALHRGLVITNSVRAELLNPMSHRFKLLRR
ncbi:unnamed protein product [Laminaria digitata]